MKLNEELSKLKLYLDENEEDKFKIQADFINDNFVSEEDKKVIEKFIASGFKDLKEHTDNFIKEIDVRIQLLEVSEIISLSYIAKKYFNKTRQWLYQKINGNLKNGAPARFTSEEIKIFNNALHDVSQKIGSINIA